MTMNIQTKKLLINVLKVILIGVAVVTPFIVMKDLFFPFITGKNFFFRVLVEIGFVLWLILAIGDKSYRPKRSPILYLFSGFVFLMFIANIFGENPARSLWSNFERMEGFIGLIHLFIYFLILSSVFKTWADWRNFLRWSVLGSFIMFLFGLTQISCSGVNSGALADVSNQTISFCKKFVINQGGVRVDGALGNAIYLAVYMLFNFFFSLLLFVKEDKRVWKIFYVLSGIGSLIMIYYTATRGVMLGLFGGLILLFLLLAFNKKINSQIRKGSSLVLIGLVAFCCMFVILRNSDSIAKFPPLKRLADISLQSSDAEARFLVWESALSGIKEKPVLGWGQENFGLVFNKYYHPEMYDREQWFDRAHNALLDIGISGGVFSLLIYLVLLLFVVILIWKKKGEHEDHPFSFVDKSILTSALLAYVFQSLFVFDNVVGSIMLMSVFALSQSFATDDNDSICDKFDINLSSQNLGVVFIVGLILASGMIYIFNYRGFMTSKVLIDAIKPQEEGLEANYQKFEQALSYGFFGRQEVREHLLQTSLALAQNQNVSTDFKNKFVNLGVSEMDKQVKETPDAIRPRFFLGAALSFFGQYDLAIDEFEEVLNRAPNKTGVIIELATAYLRKGDNENAFLTAKKAYDGDPNLSSLRQIYVAVAIRTGNQSKISDLWNIMSPKEKAGDIILQALADRGDFSKIIEILKVAFEQDKKDRTVGLYLASAYNEVGDKGNAISILEEMIKVDPDFEIEGRQYIEQFKK